MCTMCKLQVLWAPWCWCWELNPSRGLWKSSKSFEPLSHPNSAPPSLYWDGISEPKLPWAPALPALLPSTGLQLYRQVSPLDPWCSLTRFTGQCNPWSCCRALPSSQDDPFVPICGACLFLPLKALNLGFRILVPFPWNRKESLKLESLLSNMVNRIIALFGFLFVILGIEPSQGLSHTRQSSITAISPDLIFWFKNVV